MIERFLEAFFRHKLLILLPVIVIPLIVGPISYFLATSYYETWAGVWTERPAYLQSDADRNAWLTPAQVQKDRLTELLQSRAFVMDVARRTPFASLLGTRAGQDRVSNLIVGNIGMVTNGNHMLAVRFRSSTPQLAVQVLNALFETYQEKSAADQASQGDLVLSFYQGQIKDGQDRLTRANDELQRYVATNPRLTSPDIIGGSSGVLVRPALSPALTDPQAAELLRRVQVEQRNVESVQQSLDRAQLAMAAALQGQDMGFQVVDPPQPPLTATRETKRVLVFPIAGLLLGLGLGTRLLVLLVAGDRAVRSDADLTGNIRVVGTVPRLQVKRMPPSIGANATRRAIGFAAGSALPPPREAH